MCVVFLIKPPLQFTFAPFLRCGSVPFGGHKTDDDGDSVGQVAEAGNAISCRLARGSLEASKNVARVASSLFSGLGRKLQTSIGA